MLKSESRFLARNFALSLPPHRHFPFKPASCEVIKLHQTFSVPQKSAERPSLSHRWSQKTDTCRILSAHLLMILFEAPLLGLCWLRGLWSCRTFLARLPSKGCKG